MVENLFQEFSFPPEAEVDPKDPVVREAIWNAGQQKCYWSRRDLPLAQMHLDHVIPRAKGGPDNLYNFVPSDGDLNTERNDAYDEEALRAVLAYVRMVIAPKVLRGIKAARARQARERGGRSKRRGPTKAERMAERKRRAEHAERIRTELLGDTAINRWAQLLTIPPLPDSQVRVIEHLRFCLDAHPERFLDPQTARIPGLPSGRDGSPLTDHAISTPRFEAAIDAEDAVNLALTDDAHGLPMDAEILKMFGIPISGWSAPPDEIRLTGLITACADLPVTRDSPRRTRLAGGSEICFPKPHGLGTRVIVQVDVRILRLLQLLDGATFEALIRNGGTVAVADRQSPLPTNRVSGDRLEDPGLVR